MADKLQKARPFLIVLIAIAMFFWVGNMKDSFAKDIDEIKEACEELAYREQCYAKAFGNLTKKTDMVYAFEVLRGLQRMDPQANGCHFIAHSISIAETEKDPLHWREVVNAAPAECSYGAVHGPLEYYASTFPEGKIPKNEIGTLCNNPDTNNCSHGLGHLLLVVNENNIDESASDCEALPHNAYSKFECLTGVFMERSTATNLVIHGLAGEEAFRWIERLPELEKLCREQTGTRSVACWKEIAHVALVNLRHDPQKIVDFCQSSPGEKEARECIDHSIGIMAAGRNFSFSKMMPICEANALASDFKKRCYPILVGATLASLPSEIPAAKKFCSSLETIYHESCFKIIQHHENKKVGRKTTDLN